MKIITRFSIIVLVFLFSAKANYSQNQQVVDSLINLINSTSDNDTLKAKYLNDLVWRIKFSNPDTSLILLSQSEKISTKLDFADGLGNSFNTRGIIYTVQGNFDTALINYQLAIDQFDRINDPNGVAFCLGNIAVMYNFQSNFDSSMHYNLKALKIRQDNGMYKEVAKSNINIGVMYFDKGYYEKSLKHYLDALSFYENMTNMIDIDSTYLGTTYCNLGNVYQELMELDKAKYYYSKSLVIYTDHADNRELSNIYNNLGDIEKTNEELKTALGYYNKAYILAKAIDEKQQILISCTNLSSYYIGINEIESATFYITEGLKYGKEINDKKHTIRLYLSFGEILKQNNDLHKAIEQYEMALKLANDAGIIKNKEEIYFSLSDIYSELNMNAKALDYYILYAAAKDSLFNEEKHKQITEMATKYEAGQKDKEIAFQNLEIEKQQIRINQQKAQQRLSFAGIAILILFLVFIVVWFIQKRKYRDELHQRHMEEQRKEEQLKTIKQSMEAGEQERVNLADQLHDDVAPLLINLRNTISEIGERFPDVPVFKKISDNISIVHNEVRNISHILYPFSVSGDNFTDSLNNYISNFKHANNIKVETSINGIKKINHIPHDIQNFIYRTIQELMNNVVKHAGASEINMVVNHGKGILNISVSDNGNGFDENGNNDGVGLRRIKKGLEIFKGTLQITNPKTKGTEVIIEIPVG